MAASASAGGAGITGQNLNIVLAGTGSISGGQGTTGIRAAAINFTGGANSLELQNGGTLLGSVTGADSNDTLIIGGAFAGTLAGASLNAGAQLGGFGALVKDGSSTWTLTGSTTFSGTTTVADGTLRGGATNALAAGSAHTVQSGGVLDLGGLNQTIGSLAGAGTVTNVGPAAATLTAGGNNSSTSFSGLIEDGAGTTALAKSGTGTLTLSGTNSYTGGTTVIGGTLLISSDGNLGATSGALTLGGGTLSFGAGTTLDAARDVTLTGSGSINSGTFTSTIAGDISGTGQLIKQGAGTLILTGENIYSGGTQINAGVLQIGSGGATGSIAGDIVNNATLTFDRTFAVSVAGDISGTGQLIKQGAATLILTGENVYAGGTQINAGVLQVGSGGTAGSIAGDVVNNGTLAFDRTDTVIVGGDISGAGVLVVQGSGSIVLTGTNTYTGGTQIDAGVLQIGNGGATGSIAGDIINNATLTFNRTGTVTVDGEISGSGAVVVEGAGSIVLTGANSYNGGTTVSSGTLLISADGNLGATSSALTLDGGTLSFGAGTTLDELRAVTLTGSGSIHTGSFTSTIAGDISGTGQLIKQGSGTLILSGESTQGAGTQIDAGVLQVGAGGTTGALAGDVVNNATLAFNRSDDIVFSGDISGSGAVVLQGTGSTVFGGTHSYTGGTTVEAGQLNVFGVLVGTTEIQVGATLTGSGTLGDVIVSGGTLSGGSGQTLNLSSLTMDNASELAVSLGAPSTTELFKVTGNLALNGTLSVTDAGTFGEGLYRLISYDGALSGSGLTIDPVTVAAFTEDLAVQTSVGGQVNLIASAASVDPGGPGTPPAPTSFSFWDGGNASLYNNGQIDGGSGRWTATSTTWANTGGTVNGPLTPVPTLAIFTGASGNVQADASEGALSVTGLQFASDGYTLSGDAIALTGPQANIRVGDGTAAGSGYVATISAALTGDAQLVKSDLGTLVLTGANSYTGGTRVAAGTLRGNAASIRGDLANMATTVFDQTADGSFAGAISGTGETIKRGAGQLTFSGNSAGFAGRTTVADGSIVLTGALGGIVDVQANGGLRIVDRGDLSASVRNDGTLTFTRADNYAYAGAISGSGQTVKQGAGVLTLAGDSKSYAGRTTISQGSILLTGGLGGSVTIEANGTLQVGNGGTRGDLTASTRNDGTLIFARSDDYDYTGALSGSGALVKRGDGLLLLSGAYSYTGSTVVEGGSVRLASALDSGTSLVIDGGEFDLGGRDQTVSGLEGESGTLKLGTGNLVVSQTTDASFGGSIVGNGSFTKAGGATLNLTGNSSFTGNALVTGGKLAVNGTLPATVTAAAGGKIGGNGTIGGLVVQNGGAAAPGNSIGLLRVSGNVTFQAGSTYEVEINVAGQGDQIAATGTATIQGGTVTVLAEQGEYAPATSYTILTADAGVSGTFAGVASNLAFLTPSLAYDARAVRLQVQRNNISFSSVATTGNQLATAAAAEQLGTTNPIYTAIVRSTADGARRGFDQLSGELHAAARTVLIQDGTRPREAVLGRADTRTPSGAWVQGIGNWVNNDGNGNAGRLSYTTTGLMVGVDKAFGDNMRVGVAGGYTHSSGDVLNRASHATVDGGHVIGYFAAASGALNLLAGGAYSWSDVDTRRTVGIGAFGDRLDGDYKGNVLQGFARIGYELALGGGKIEPFGAVAVMREHVGRFAERGGAAALSAAKADRTITYSTLGIALETPFADGRWAIRAQGGWDHGFGDLTSDRIVRFGTGPQMDIEGAPLSRESGVVDAALVWRPADRLQVSVGYNGRIGTVSQDHGARASLSLAF